MTHGLGGKSAVPPSHLLIDDLKAGSEIPGRGCSTHSVMGVKGYCTYKRITATKQFSLYLIGAIFSLFVRHRHPEISQGPGGNIVHPSVDLYILTLSPRLLDRIRLGQVLNLLLHVLFHHQGKRFRGPQ